VVGWPVRTSAGPGLESLESSEVVRTVAAETVNGWRRSLVPAAVAGIGLLAFISGDVTGAIEFVLEASRSLVRQS
jgi:hypothetical protein